MKKLHGLWVFALLLSLNTQANSITESPLLDGSKVTHYDRNSWGANVEFYDGELIYEWIAGPQKANGNKDLACRSRKIDDRIYIINWLEESRHDFMALIFYFPNNLHI